MSESKRLGWVGLRPSLDSVLLSSVMALGIALLQSLFQLMLEDTLYARDKKRMS
jgi:hypothetical protein